MSSTNERSGRRLLLSNIITVNEVERRGEGRRGREREGEEGGRGEAIRYQ